MEHRSNEFNWSTLIFYSSVLIRYIRLISVLYYPWNTDRTDSTGFDGFFHPFLSAISVQSAFYTILGTRIKRIQLVLTDFFSSVLIRYIRLISVLSNGTQIKRI